MRLYTFTALVVDEETGEIEKIVNDISVADSQAELEKELTEKWSPEALTVKEIDDKEIFDYLSKRAKEDPLFKQFIEIWKCNYDN